MQFSHLIFEKSLSELCCMFGVSWKCIFIHYNYEFLLQRCWQWMWPFWKSVSEISEIWCNSRPKKCKDLHSHLSYKSKVKCQKKERSLKDVKSCTKKFWFQMISCPTQVESCCPERYDLWLGVTLQKVKTNWAIWVSITHMVLSFMYSQNKGFILVKTSLRFSKLGFTNAHVENITVSKQKLVKCNWTVIGSLCDLAITWKVGVLWRTHQDQKFCNTVILILSYTII